MRTVLKYTFVLFVTILSTTQVISGEEVKFKSLYSEGTSNVVLSTKSNPTKKQMQEFGRSNCRNKSFCLIWFFDNSEQAKIGVIRAKAGNWFDPIPGLIAIYSKNKKWNEIICHEPSGTC